MRFVLQLLTWWNGQTIGTRLFTWLKGAKVGEDQFGNSYFESKNGRRWVVYAGYSEASRVPTEWHGWLHHTYDNRPGQDALERQDWELEHQENMTGTEHAYAPAGSQYSDGQTQGTYTAWNPNS